MKLDKLAAKWLKKFSKSHFHAEKERKGMVVRDVVETPERLKEIAGSNLDSALDFLKHRHQWSCQGLGEDVEFPKDLERIIVNPGSDVLPIVKDGENEIQEYRDEIVLRMHDKDNRLEKYVDSMERMRMEEMKSIEALKKKHEESQKGKYRNFHILENIEEGGVFESNLLSSGIRCALILTDTFFTRDTHFYKRIIGIFERNKIPFVEFTNIQPNLDRKLLFRIHEFASDHDVNSIVAVGSMSTIELSKLLLPKLMKPNIIRLHKNREFDLAIAANYSIFSIPTFVVPDPKVNSRSAVKNHLFFPDHDFFGNTLYLKNEIDDADGVFYCSDVFDHLKSEKVTEALHEVFFRLIFSYFDLSADDELLAEVIRNIRVVLRLLEVIGLSGRFDKDDRYEFMRIVSFIMDGRLVVDSWDFWLLYKLEGALSLMVNSKKSDGLALFMPIFFEVMSKRSQEFHTRALQFGSSMYGSYSIEGCICKLSMHIKKYGLPTSLIDVEQVKKVDYKFLSALLRKAKAGTHLGALTKEVMNHIRTF